MSLKLRRQMGLLWHDARLGAHSSRNQATQFLDPKQNAGHWGWSITPTFSLESPGVSPMSSMELESPF